MKISKKDAQLLIVFLGVLIIAFTYFFIFTKYKDKTDILEAENAVMQDEVTKLEALDVQKQTYISQIELYDSENVMLQSEYDSGYTPEDDIMYIAEMEGDSANEVTVSYLNFAVPVLQPAVITTTTGEMGMVPVDNGVVMFKVPMDFGFSVTYEGLKNTLNYIYTTGGKKSIDSINLTFDTATGQLAGNMMANRFFLSGTNQIYSPTSIPTMGSGVENIFRTADGYMNSVLESETSEIEE